MVPADVKVTMMNDDSDIRQTMATCATYPYGFSQTEQ